MSPIAASDLIPLGSLNRPENDVDTGGGAKDVDHRPSPMTLAAADVLEILSDNAADTTQTVTITGRNAAGGIISDVQTLNGTTPVTMTGTFERVLKVVMSADAVGIVTVRRDSGGATVDTIPVGERGFFSHFQRSASESGATLRYEKDFWLNNHGTLTLNSAELELTADPSSKIRIGGAPSVDDSATVTDRKTSPAGVTFVDDAVAQGVPGGELLAGEAIGIWAELGLDADDAPLKSSFTTQLDGTSV